MDEPLTRIIASNDLHVIWTNCLDAAQKIHVAMCWFDDDHAAQSHLNSAMHSALIGAEQCRQLHSSRKHRLAPEPETEDDGE